MSLTEDLIISALKGTPEPSEDQIRGLMYAALKLECFKNVYQAANLTQRILWQQNIGACGTPAQIEASLEEALTVSEIKALQDKMNSSSKSGLESKDKTALNSKLEEAKTRLEINKLNFNYNNQEGTINLTALQNATTLKAIEDAITCKSEDTKKKIARNIQRHNYSYGEIWRGEKWQDAISQILKKIFTPRDLKTKYTEIGREVLSNIEKFQKK